MNISNLTFPLTIDFSGGKYWINGGGPYQCREAATAFLAGERNRAPGNTSQLTQELEAVHKTFGSHLSPFFEEQKTTHDLYQRTEHGSLLSQLRLPSAPRLRRSGGAVHISQPARFPLCGTGPSHPSQQCAQAVPFMRRLVPSQAGRPGHLL